MSKIPQSKIRVGWRGGQAQDPLNTPLFWAQVSCSWSWSWHCFFVLVPSYSCDDVEKVYSSSGHGERHHHAGRRRSGRRERRLQRPGYELQLCRRLGSTSGLPARGEAAVGWNNDVTVLQGTRSIRVCALSSSAVEFTSPGPVGEVLRGWTGGSTPWRPVPSVEFAAAGPLGRAGRLIPSRRGHVFPMAHVENGGNQRRYSDFSIDRILDLIQTDSDDIVEHRQPTSFMIPGESYKTPSFSGTKNVILTAKNLL